VLLEVTQRCNLSCPVCFAGSRAGTGSKADDPSLETIARWYERLYRRAGACHIQLSGGEPTLRDDLAAIIQLGRDRGFRYFQLNTNGLRLAAEPKLVQQLKAAGLTCVFLQFDGIGQDVHQQLRGADLQAIKESAVQACRKARVPVILVPTLARGINEHQLMSLVNFGISQSPTVRGIHIQPMARFGRTEVSAEGLSLDEIAELLERQSTGMIKASHFSKGNAEHPDCSFNAHYFINDEGALEPSGAQRSSCCGRSDAVSACCGRPDAVSHAQDIQARRWGTDLDALPTQRPPSGSMDEFLWQAKARSFAITGMAFMDEQTLDIKRLQRCYLFILDPQGNPIPFCAYNIAHRGRCCE
jgi:uncharacterized radical SAM superfamily Fe-S cluster-containing enzyme